MMNHNNNATTNSPSIYQFQRQASAPSAPAPSTGPKRPSSAVPFNYAAAQGRSTPVQGRSTPIQSQGRSTPVQGQSTAVRQSPIPGALSLDANKNKGLSMFLRQQQRHMEPEEIAAGYTSGEGSRPTTPVLGSPQVGRATPIQQSNPVPTGRSTPVQIGRTTPIIPGSQTINTGRTAPLNMPNRKPVTPSTPPTSPMLGPKLGVSDSMQNYESKSPINLAAFMTPSSAKTNTPKPVNNFTKLSSSWGGSSAPTTPDPPLPPLPTIAPLTLVPKAPPPPPTSGSAPAGRTTPVFGSSTPLGRAGPAGGPPKTTGTATPFLKGSENADQKYNCG